MDDDPDLRELLGQLLRRHGHLVLTTGDASEALEYLNDGHRVGLVILDLEMPAMTGCDFLARKELDDKLRRVPVAVLSAMAGADAAVAPFSVEIVLHKPVAANVLLELVEQFCVS